MQDINFKIQVIIKNIEYKQACNNYKNLIPI